MIIRVRPSWPRGYVVTGDDLRDLDANSILGVDGHAGGTYAPAAPLIVGGAGVQIISKSVAENGAALVPASGKTITFGEKSATDAFRFGSPHAGKTRSCLHGISEAWSPRGHGDVGLDMTSIGVQSKTPGARYFVPFRVIDGATLTLLTLRWKLGEAHANVPLYLPRFRVVRVSALGVLEPLRAEDTTTDRDGWVTWGPRPASGAAYGTTSDVKTLAYTCNQNNVIDRSAYFYVAEIEDEHGTNAFSGSADGGNLFLSTVATYVSITRLALRQ